MDSTFINIISFKTFNRTVTPEAGCITVFVNFHFRLYRIAECATVLVDHCPYRSGSGSISFSSGIISVRIVIHL